MEAEVASTSTNSLKEENPSTSKTPETPSRCKSPGSPIGDDACPICLGAFNDKCAAGSCLHNFCLVCLKEWAKQRPVCPLCKQSFTKILYDIKSETDYKEWEVPGIYPPDLNEIGNRGFIEERVYRSLSEFLDNAHRRFFSYRSTIMSRRRRGNSTQNSINTNVLPNIPRGRRDHHAILDHERGSSIFRLSIYTNNVWIQPMSDITGRYRECNPNLYREQPALTHRLVPWINRELAALLPPSRIGVVLSDIMDLIERYRINSREFRRALRPHLGANTRHFVHEFYNFARSPYDMIGHDSAAQYIPRYFVDDTDDDSDDTDEEVIEIESDGIIVESEPLDLSSRVAREETIGNDGSVFISSDSDIDLNESRNAIDENTHNPEPPMYMGSSLLPSALQRSSQDRNRLSSNLDEPGPSGVSSSGSLPVKKESSDLRNSSDSEDCIVVDVLKPKGERTPELIDISSNSDGETSDRTHWKKKMSKEIEGKHSKSRKKPRLDRTSFSLRFSGTVNCQRGEDHTYCTESASPCNPGSNRTESEDDSLRFRKRAEFKWSQTTQRKRYNIMDSDSDTDSSDNYGIESRKRKAVVKKRPRNSRSKSFSPSEEAPRKVRKDQRSKVKSSSHVTRSMAKSTTKDSKTTSSSSNNISSSKIKKHLKSSKRRNSDAYNKMLRYRRSRSSRSSSSGSSSSSSSSSTTSSSSTSSSSSSSSCRSSKSSSKRSSFFASYISSFSDYSCSSEVEASSDRTYHPTSSNFVLKRRKKKKPLRTSAKVVDKKAKEDKKKGSKKSKGKKISEKSSKKGTSRKYKK